VINVGLLGLIVTFIYLYVVNADNGRFARSDLWMDAPQCTMYGLISFYMHSISSQHSSFIYQGIVRRSDMPRRRTDGS